jgi:hypothetical protein
MRDGIMALFSRVRWHPPEPSAAKRVIDEIPGLGMSRAKYYRRQADICMRLSLLSEDGEIAELLINKAMELMSQAETAAAEDAIAAAHDAAGSTGGQQ